MASSIKAKNLRSSLSFPNLILSCLNFSLFVLAAASVVPIVLLRTPPTSLGMAFLMVSAISLLSSFVGFYSQLARFCFVTHVSILVASLAGQVLGVLALFTKENSTLSLMKPTKRNAKEARLLARLECGVLMAMVLLQAAVLVLSCAVQSCWVREYEGLEAERDAAAMKRNRRIAKVQEESLANAEKIAEIKAKELEEKMKTKYGGRQWVKTDFEG